MSEDYNGWANYETWKIKLDLVDDLLSRLGDEEIEKLSPEDLKEYVEEVIEENEQIAKNYANAFVSKVDYYEILGVYKKIY